MFPIEYILKDMSPSTKVKWGKGLTIGWRSIGLAFFMYAYSYMQAREAKDIRMEKNQETILKNQQWQKYQLEAMSSYRAQDMNEHDKMRDDIKINTTSIAEIKGRLSRASFINY